MNKNAKYLSIFLVSGSLVLMFYIYFFFQKSDEIQSKREWSILQVVENQYRGRELDERVLVVTRERHVLAGVISSDKDVRVWIMLDPQYAPLIKEMPAANYSLSPNEMQRILQEFAVHEAVVKHLQLKMKPEQQGGRRQNRSDGSVES